MGFGDPLFFSKIWDSFSVRKNDVGSRSLNDFRRDP